MRRSQSNSVRLPGSEPSGRVGGRVGEDGVLAAALQRWPGRREKPQRGAVGGLSFKEHFVPSGALQALPGLRAQMPRGPSGVAHLGSLHPRAPAAGWRKPHLPGQAPRIRGKKSKDPHSQPPRRRREPPKQYLYFNLKMNCSELRLFGLNGENKFTFSLVSWGSWPCRPGLGAKKKVSTHPDANESFLSGLPAKYLL